MSTDTHKYINQVEQESRHSALAEFSRDERRPAVLLLSALVIAVLFFTIGLVFGRWTAVPETNLSASKSGTAAQVPLLNQPPAQTVPAPAKDAAAGASAPDTARHFTLLVAAFDSHGKAEPLVKALQGAGYKDVRIAPPSTTETRPTYGVLVGHFTRDEAREAVQRMHTANDHRLENAKVIEEQ